MIYLILQTYVLGAGVAVCVRNDAIVEAYVKGGWSGAFSKAFSWPLWLMAGRSV